MQFMFAWKRKRGHLRCQPPDCNRYGRPHLLFRHRWQHVNLPCTTPRGFEPLRAEPNGFRVHLLNHSDTVSTNGHATWLRNYWRRGHMHCQSPDCNVFGIAHLLSRHDLQSGSVSLATQRGLEPKCGQAPMDFESTSLAIRAQFRCMGIHFRFTCGGKRTMKT